MLMLTLNITQVDRLTSELESAHKAREGVQEELRELQVRHERLERRCVCTRQYYLRTHHDLSAYSRAAYPYTAH